VCPGVDEYEDGNKARLWAYIEMCPRIRVGIFTDSLEMYRDAEKSLARKGRKKANISVRMA